MSILVDTVQYICNNCGHTFNVARDLAENEKIPIPCPNCKDK